jgi:hypothetical protein
MPSGLILVVQSHGGGRARFGDGVHDVLDILNLGFLLSAVVKVVVSKSEASSPLPNASPKSIGKVKNRFS